MRYAHSNVKIPLVVILALLVTAVYAPFSSAAPTTTLTISEPKFITTTSTTHVSALTEFSLSADLLGSSTWYHWDSYPYTKYIGPFTAVVEMASTGGAPPLPIDLDDGLHTLYFNSTDGTAQSELPKSISIYVDNSVPTTTMQFTGAHFSGTSEVIKSDTQISLSSIDAASGVASISYIIDSGQYITYQAPFTVTAPGQHAIAYHAVDNVNNQEIDKMVNILVDSGAPTVEIVPGNPNIAVAGTIYVRPTTLISLSAQDISGIAESSYRIDSGAWTSYTAPFTVATQGQHIITGRATDNMGAVSTEATLTINVDSTPPVVSINGFNDSTINIKKGESIAFNCSDAGVGQYTIYYSFDNATSWTEYTASISIDKDQTITYYASDALGNEAAQMTVYMNVAEPKSWTLYLGIALIVSGVVVGASVFFFTRKKPEPKANKSEEEQEKKPKKKKIRRNY